jgi:transaldolase/glucose-6-phosphate isomerase
MNAKVSLQTAKLPEALAASVKANIEGWGSGDKVRRLWQHDASLWTGTDESNWLGWLESLPNRSLKATNCAQRWWRT